MTRLPLTARIFVSVVILSGAGLVAASLPLVRFPRPGLFASLLALSVISSALKVDMPVGVGSSCISLSYIVDFTALLLLGPQPTMLIAMASGWCHCTSRMKERNPTYKTVFSMACLALTVAAAGFAYRWLGGTPGSLSATPLQPLLAAALTYFLVNSLAVAAAFALATIPILRLHDNFLWSISSYVIGGLVAGLTVELFQRAGHWQTSLALVPLCLTYRTTRFTSDESRPNSDASRNGRSCTARARRCWHARFRRRMDRTPRTSSAYSTRRDAGATPSSLRIGQAGCRDSGAVARRRQAGRARADPVETRSADRRRTPQDADSCADRRGIVGAVPFPFPVAPLVLSHHERWDGTGYPSGLRGAQIPIGARILAVVDCFDAVTSERPYRRAVSQDDALRILHAGAGNAFDRGSSRNSRSWCRH